MNSVVIVAAGSGRRMNLDINKQYIKLDEKEMIAHTIDVFYSNENIDEIIVCIREEEAYFFEHEILDKYDFRNIKIKGQKEDFTGLRFFNGGWKRDFWGNFPSKDEIEAYIKLKNGKR